MFDCQFVFLVVLFHEHIIRSSVTHFVGQGLCWDPRDGTPRKNESLTFQYDDVQCPQPVSGMDGFESFSNTFQERSADTTIQTDGPVELLRDTSRRVSKLFKPQKSLGKLSSILKAKLLSQPPLSGVIDCS
jgi:hypothetical protein